LIIAAGVKRVVVGTWDPNPAESGRGVARLRAAGIVVQFSGEWEACRKLNEPYFKYITTGVPHVTVKLACSLDGRIATGAGDAKWLSSARAMKFVHELRRDSNAVMVGGGTAAADDPELTVRRVRPRTRPLRVVVSSRLALSPELKVFQEQETVPTVVYTTEAREPEVERALLARGVAVEVVAAKGGRVSLAAVLERLGRREVSRVLVEGGGELAGALLAEGQVDRLVAIYTPLLLGRQARPSFAFDGLEKLSENPRYVIEEVKRLGPDVAVNVRVGKMWGERPC
jgi:diaminohydroxyphosphoribosylaminopyrimidine deaminase/5-amino-6-(5-phosphoribosylamino)uracil reductase